MVLHVERYRMGTSLCDQIIGVVRNHFVVTPDHPYIRSGDCVAHVSLL